MTDVPIKGSDGNGMIVTVLFRTGLFEYGNVTMRDWLPRLDGVTNTLAIPTFKVPKNKVSANVMMTTPPLSVI